MNWTLEVVVIPVSDLDRAKTFYAEQVCFNVDFEAFTGPRKDAEAGCNLAIPVGNPQGPIV